MQAEQDSQGPDSWSNTEERPCDKAARYHPCSRGDRASTCAAHRGARSQCGSKTGRLQYSRWCLGCASVFATSCHAPVLGKRRSAFQTSSRSTSAAFRNICLSSFRRGLAAASVSRNSRSTCRHLPKCALERYHCAGQHTFEHVGASAGTTVCWVCNVRSGCHQKSTGLVRGTSNCYNFLLAPRNAVPTLRENLAGSALSLVLLPALCACMPRNPPGFLFLVAWIAQNTAIATLDLASRPNSCTIGFEFPRTPSQSCSNPLYIPAGLVSELASQRFGADCLMALQYWEALLDTCLERSSLKLARLEPQPGTCTRSTTCSQHGPQILCIASCLLQAR